ncbi:G protein-activated inward rectifier potassium channel 4 [Eumeta japonica]|uniref:G protein-activated inward rectifier potassium channel 4 n=1 Tax=Eumeta variegata TaxID=151549 RepID=A0A4C1Y0X8_EUMVA|nr:G protein-activated inward rectifier potassium channel 4 [Eumeta japonica]
MYMYHSDNYRSYSLEEIQSASTDESNALVAGVYYPRETLDHDDLSEENLPSRRNATKWTPCIEEIYGFTSTFLFSIEVHTTVAYGHRSITLECPQAILAMCLQCIVSSIVQAFMVGILFAKLTRPKARTHTVLFTRNAVVNQRDEQLCLSFRVGDVRKSRIVNLKAAAYLVTKCDDEIENNMFEQIKLNVVIDGCDSIFFLWPVSVVHTIDEDSPLYGLSAADFLCGNFEIFVVVEGTIESTGQPIQARSSYTEKEIMWGHRFVSMVEMDETDKFYVVDYSKISETEHVDTPLCSAQELKLFKSTTFLNE